eukprot:2105238-Amphidinium_carterae.1
MASWIGLSAVEGFPPPPRPSASHRQGSVASKLTCSIHPVGPPVQLMNKRAIKHLTGYRVLGF